MITTHISHSMAAAWGIHTSLYSGLSKEHVKALEEAICARYSGHLALALTIFEERLPPAHTVAVIAIEKAELLQWMGHEKDSAVLCRQCVGFHQHHGSHGSNVLNLLILLEALYLISTSGKLLSALETTRKLRTWFNTMSMTACTSTEVCLSFSKLYLFSAINH